MSFINVVKVELVKLYHKRISLLLLLFFVPAVLFGVGMGLGLSFFVADGGGTGVDAVGKALSGMGFAVNMLEQSKYIIFLVLMILAATSFSGELENGQMKSEILKICSRSKILLAKYVALLVAVCGVIVMSVLWSLLIYAGLVRGTEFASGTLYDELLGAHVGYILFTLLGAAVALAVTFLLGTRRKTFPCFAISYILWFASLYSDFIEKIKLLIPYNMPNYLLEHTVTRNGCGAYAGLYSVYCFVFLAIACLIFSKSDMKA